MIPGEEEDTISTVGARREAECLRTSEFLLPATEGESAANSALCRNRTKGIYRMIF